MGLSRLGMLVALGLGVVLGSAQPVPVVAQQGSGSGAEAPVCLSRQIPAAGPFPARQLAIVVPSSNAAAMEAKGFTPGECASLFAGVEEQLAWRDEMCRITANAPEAMKGQLVRYLGEHPAVLCGMAEEVLGSWDASQVVGQ